MKRHVFLDFITGNKKRSQIPGIDPESQRSPLVCIIQMLYSIGKHHGDSNVKLGISLRPYICWERRGVSLLLEVSSYENVCL